MPEVGTVYQKSFEWKILNFLNLDLNQGKSIESPPFILIGKDGIQKKFYLMLYAKGEEADWVAVYLTSYDSLISCTLSYKVGILDKDEKQLIHITVKDQTYCEKGLGWGAKLVEIQKLKSEERIILPNGTLTILFELDSVKDKPKDPTMCLVDDLETLATNDEFTDIEIQCKDIRIKAHKAILGSRSSVFKAMFTNACKESQTGSVNINNMEPEVLQDLITFMYSCKVKKLKENVADLFIAADMYMMESLKGRLYVLFKARVSTSILFQPIIVFFPKLDIESNYFLLQ